jgi:hypothetical protein
MQCRACDGREGNANHVIHTMGKVDLLGSSTEARTLVQRQLTTVAWCLPRVMAGSVLVSVVG